MDRLLRYVFILVAGMLVMAGPVAPRPDPLPTPEPADAFLERQTEALREEFQDDLQDLADVPRYSIEATLSPERNVVGGVLTLHYTNTTGASLDRLVFRLLPNATAIYGGGRLDVRSVTHAGSPVAPELSPDGTVLTVPLLPRLPNNAVTTVRIEFTATVPTQTTQGYGIFNQAHGVTLLAGWYPVLTAYDDGWLAPDIPTVGDAILADISLYDVLLRVPAGMTVVSTGVETRVGQDSDGVTWRLISGPARDFAVAVSDRFEVHRTIANGTALTLYALPTGDREPATSAPAALDVFADAFRVYSERFGAYPLTELDVVETFITIDGYEFAGMVAGDYQTRLDAPPRDYRFLLSHEIAHQWWYNLVGNNPIDEPWLDESLATYATLVYFEDVYGAGDAQITRSSWMEEHGPSRGSLPAIPSSTHTFSEWTPYNTVTYYHGTFFLDTLRDTLGDDRFFALLNRYFQRYRYSRATTEDFVNLAAREPALSAAEIRRRLGIAP